MHNRDYAQLTMKSCKCRMCGGTVEFKDGEILGICDSCGTTQPFIVENSDTKSSNISMDEIKSKIKGALDAGAGAVDEAVNSVSKELDETTANYDKKKNIILGIIFLFVFWPVSIYFFVKASKD